MNHETYLPEATYQNLIAALLALTPTALESECTDRLKLILGETGGIWPSSARTSLGPENNDCIIVSFRI